MAEVMIVTAFIMLHALTLLGFCIYAVITGGKS